MSGDLHEISSGGLSSPTSSPESDSVVMPGLAGADTKRTPAQEEISKCWQTLEDQGFPPEASGWPLIDLSGELPNAIDCAIACLVRQRNDLLSEVVKLRAAVSTQKEPS